MIKIDLNRKRLNKELEELETDYNNGNISKKEYFSRKRDIGQEFETLQAAEHVRRMQGRMGSEKSLDYWSDQEEEQKKIADEAEKEEMLKKYITNPDSIKGKEVPRREWFGKKAKISLVAFILIAFVVGTSLGSMFISKPSETPSVSMVVNASAFLPTPVNNTTTSTTKTNITKTTQTTTKNTQTNTPTPTNTQTNTKTNTKTNNTG